MQDATYERSYHSVEDAIMSAELLTCLIKPPVGANR